jgi:predicted acetyltransferase
MLYLCKLNKNMGLRELEYLREVSECENGFYNPASLEALESLSSFKKWLVEKENESLGINLKEGYVPQTIYFIMENEKIIGIGKIRHYLNENLLVRGGHIGIGISSNCRGKGIGTKALELLLYESLNIYGIEKVLLTNSYVNIASRRIVEKCGGVLESINNGVCKYWVNLEKKKIKKK